MELLIIKFGLIGKFLQGKNSTKVKKFMGCFLERKKLCKNNGVIGLKNYAFAFLVILLF